MTLGPSSLSRNPSIIRSTLKRIDNKKIVNSYLLKNIEWDDKSLAPLKNLIRLNLRKEQQGRCIFCRRIILIERRNACEDIEHFLDKSKSEYRRWAFCFVNLALACHACNLEKGVRDLGSTQVKQSVGYVVGAGAYRWLHPYFDSYHDNIEILRGWTYSIKINAPAAAQARNMIDECKLANVQAIEASAEAIKKHIYRLTVLTGKAMNSNRNELAKRLNEMCKTYQEDYWSNY